MNTTDAYVDLRKIGGPVITAGEAAARLKISWLRQALWEDREDLAAAGRTVDERLTRFRALHPVMPVSSRIRE